MVATVTDEETGDTENLVKRTQSTPGGSQFKPCSAGSKAHAQPGQVPRRKSRVTRALIEVTSKDFFSF